MDRKICCFTGHRHIPHDIILRLPEKLDSLIDELIASGYREFRCGGAQGFDTIAALKVLEKKKTFGDEIKLCLYLPCKDQTRGWSESAKRAYSLVLERADSVCYAAEAYNSGCMHARNRALVDGSDLCVAFCLSSSGGTAYTLLYAKKQGVPVRVL
jgi:uncharacterized phage-like protein YoqJ